MVHNSERNTVSESIYASKNGFFANHKAVILGFLCVFLTVITLFVAPSALSALGGELEIYYGSRSGTSGLCPNPEVKTSCICTEDKVFGIYRERCVSIPNAFQTLESESELTEEEATELLNASSETSSTFAYPRVRFAYYLWGSQVKVRHLGVGECAFVKTVRHCARLTPGDKNPGDEDYDPAKNYGNDLVGDTSGRSENGIPLRLCVFHDPWDIKDSNGQFSPFHKNTPLEEAQRITESMRASSWGGEEWLGSGSRVVSGWDSFWTIITGGTYNNNVRSIVGCAPIPLAPFPPPFCDKCKVLGNLPDPRAALKSGSTFEEATLSVALKEFEFNQQKNIYEVVDATAQDLPVGKCIESDDKQYCASYCSAGEEICFFELGQNIRVLQYIARPDFMPLPKVENVTTDTNYPKMKVSIGAAPNTETATLSLNESGEECAILHGVELCAVRECELWDQATGICTQRAAEVCLEGYNPQPFDVSGYHPSKGVVVYNDTGGYAPTTINSQHGGKIYFDAKSYFLDPEHTTLPANYNHRAFEASELDLCINGGWRWPTAEDTIHTVAETKGINVDPACREIEVEMFGAGAAGQFIVGGQNNAENDHAGGSGAYIKARIPLGQGSNIVAQIGRGGKTIGANGQATSIKINGVTFLTANGASGRFGGTTYVKSGSNIAVLNRQNGQTRDVRATGPTPQIGGKTPVLNFQQPQTQCELGNNPTDEDHWGAGGCVRDDYAGADKGRWGKGGNGGMSISCTRYADSQPELSPMPELQ